MSDPGDPFGRNDKTVLRLNPGGRRPAQQATAPTAPVPPQPSGYQNPPQQFTPPPASYTPTAASGARPDDWFTPPPPPPPIPTTGSGRALILKRDVPVAANENLLLEAAGPLLLLLGRLRVSLMSANFANLMEQVAAAIEDFEKRMRGESVNPDQTEMAKYAICATADDIVQHIPSEERHVWTQYSMLSRFFGERVGGVKFFEKLDQAKMDPSANYPVLELQYACLALGFQGVHRTSPNGPATLQMLQRNLYELLRKVRPKVKDDLSPNWRGQSLPSSVATFRIPFWALAALAAALLFGLFVTLRILLSGNADTVTDEMRRLFADTALGIERASVPVPAEPVPPPPVRISTQLERIRAKLAPEIAAKQADAVENGSSIIVRVGDYASFASGQAVVLETFKPIAAKIAATLEKEPGEIRIVGHTDSTRITTARFPSNYELSVERAKAVTALLKQGISKEDRFKVDGKGDTQPIGSNQTAEGRARNRRVEISIPREETLNRP
jgi:type VI secretion system protein ImpK